MARRSKYNESLQRWGVNIPVSLKGWVGVQLGHVNDGRLRKVNMTEAFIALIKLAQAHKREFHALLKES